MASLPVRAQIPAFRVDVRDFSKLSRFLERFAGKASRSDQAWVLSKLANSSKFQAYDRFQAVFDRPTRYTMSSLFSTNAKAENLVAEVGFRFQGRKGSTPAWQYLGPQIMGGGRSFKRMERSLQFSGLLAQSEYVVPGQGASLDRYGNLPGGRITQALSYLRANARDPLQNRSARVQGQKRSRNRTSRYFVPRPNHPLPRGVYERRYGGHGAPIKSFMYFTRKAPRYTPRLDWTATLLHGMERRLMRYWIRRLKGEGKAGKLPKAA